MTMDIHQREREHEFLTGSPSPPRRSSPPVVTQPKASKRSFDVAFLMAPDDLSKKRQQQLRLVTTASLMQRYSPPHQIQHPVIQSSPFGLLLPSPRDYVIKEDETKEVLPNFTKSAFTKVNAGDNAPRLDLSNISQQPTSPSSVSSGEGISPDVTYQESLSPPVLTRERTPPYIPTVKTVQHSQPLPYFAGSSKPSSYLYQTSASGSTRDKLNGSGSSSPIEQQITNGSTTFLGPYLSKSPPLLTTLADKPKIRPNLLYPSENLPPPYGGLTVTTYPFPTNFSPAGSSVPPHPLLTAAANVTAALLPPSLAALTLPAQNVCAKCNVSFRMTSDLVYHMRSHHKSESTTTDAARRRREQEKLKCPVCNESFRERHHLTRHMTAHQDKEGDHVEEESDSSRTRISNK
ncbi:uncharacterized protein LOC142331763 [Lycorma delicatula]|uniref:uncharacterized protein LOC142331763 n=1 Tax=Lycorma delicatula TaxID=130591 RepID=UPI003F50F3E3